MKKEIKIDGMHCEHCVARIEKALSSVSGVDKVKVNLKKGLAKVECAETANDSALKDAVESLGFTVTGIE